MTDAELKALLNRAGINESFYEGEIGETNMPIWRNLVELAINYHKGEYDVNAGVGQKH